MKLKRRDKLKRYKNGGFGHREAKYSKNPAIQHMRNREGFASTYSVTPIDPAFSSVHDAFNHPKK